MCKQCRSIHYCSSRCQKIDWQSYKLLCAQHNNDDERRSPSHRRAILSPDSEKQLRFIWIECQEMEEGGHKWEEPQSVQHHLSPDCGLVERTSFDRDRVRNGPPEHSIEIHSRNALGWTAQSLHKASLPQFKEQMHMNGATLLSCYGKMVIAAHILGHLVT